MLEGELRGKIIQLHHNTPVGEYRGRWKTVELVARNYWWPGVTKEVERYVDRCDIYQRYKNRSKAPVGKLMPNVIPEKPWSHISVDFITKLPLAQGYNAILVVCDCSDRGVQFVVGIIRELNNLLGIQMKLSTVYHPQTDGQTERINQELEQYLRVFIDHRQEQWLDWLGIAEFMYNNKIYTATKISLFKVNYGQDLRMGFEGRRKGKYEVVGKFVKRMKKIQEEAKAVLGKVQKEMKKFANRRKRKEKEYRVGDLVMLSTKDLKWQMKRRRSEKLTECFVGPYKVKGIVSSNAIELELPKSIRIHPMVSVSRV